VDYVLVTWLVANRSALSYAVGEWAQIWPLSAMIRAMGAFFVRRNSRNTLYRRVLARYVQMAADEGVAQAIFPEGGLSLDGRVGEAKLGLLSYFVAGADRSGRDIVFVPVGLAYDRVLEDRLLTEAARTGRRRFRPTVGGALVFALRMVWRGLRGNFPGFGAAAAGFGAPISLKAHLAAGHGDPTAALGAALMARVAAAVPVLPVPLVAAALLAHPADRAALLAEMARIIARLEAAGAALRLHPGGLEATAEEGLTHLSRRGFLRSDLSVVPAKAALLSFYGAPLRDRADNVGLAATRQT